MIVNLSARGDFMMAVLKSFASFPNVRACRDHFTAALECSPQRTKAWVLHRRGSMSAFLSDMRSARQDFARSMQLLRHEEGSSMWPYDPPGTVRVSWQDSKGTLYLKTPSLHQYVPCKPWIYV